jgi:hypothetical protein
VPWNVISKPIHRFPNRRFPFDRPVRFYGFSQTNRAIADSTRGHTIKLLAGISK